MAPSGALATPGISSANGNKSAIGSGAIKSGGIIGGGGVRASTSTWGPLPIFNLDVEFFYVLPWNY